jgi:hypothetical protein
MMKQEGLFRWSSGRLIACIPNHIGLTLPGLEPGILAATMKKIARSSRAMMRVLVWHARIHSITRGSQAE